MSFRANKGQAIAVGSLPNVGGSMQGAQATVMSLADSNLNEINLGAPAPLGEYSVSAPTTATTLANLIVAAVTATTIAPGSPTTLPATATFVRIGVEANDIRVSYFGNNSASGTFGVAVIGELYAKGASYPFNSDLTKLVIAAQTGAATLRISVFA